MSDEDAEQPSFDALPDHHYLPQRRAEVWHARPAVALSATEAGEPSKLQAGQQQLQAAGAPNGTRPGAWLTNNAAHMVAQSHLSAAAQAERPESQDCLPAARGLTAAAALLPTSSNAQQRRLLQAKGAKGKSTTASRKRSKKQQRSVADVLAASQKRFHLHLPADVKPDFAKAEHIETDDNADPCAMQDAAAAHDSCAATAYPSETDRCGDAKATPGLLPATAMAGVTSSASRAPTGLFSGKARSKTPTAKPKIPLAARKQGALPASRRLAAVPDQAQPQDEIDDNYDDEDLATSSNARQADAGNAANAAGALTPCPAGAATAAASATTPLLHNPHALLPDLSVHRMASGTPAFTTPGSAQGGAVTPDFPGLSTARPHLLSARAMQTAKYSGRTGRSSPRGAAGNALSKRLDAAKVRARYAITLYMRCLQR